MIAVELIGYLLTRQEAKNVIFIVPTRALVDQQAKYIKQHSDVPSCTVAELSGMEMASRDAQWWEVCKKSNRVLVGTAEVFRMSLVDTGFLKVCDLSLCVFDECHNVRASSMS